MAFTNDSSENKLSKNGNLNDENKYLVINVANEHIGFELSYIREIIRLPEVTIIPDSPDYLRGMIKLRDLVIPLIDIRKKMGFPSIEDENNEFIALLKEREQDHINWIQELTNSTIQRYEFKLTADPHACKFGKWYDTYKPQNFAIASFLEKFDKPHKEIHKLAHKVQDVIKTEGYESAIKICENSKYNELKAMVDLFDELYKLIKISNREFAVVFDNHGKKKAITCDKINRIIPVKSEMIQKANTLKYDDYVKGLCQVDDLLFTILDENVLI